MRLGQPANTAAAVITWMYFHFLAALCRWPAIIYGLREVIGTTMAGGDELITASKSAVLKLQPCVPEFFKDIFFKLLIWEQACFYQWPWQHHFLLLCPLWLMLLTCGGFRASPGVCFGNTIFIVLYVFEIQNQNLSVLIVFLMFGFDLWQISSCVFQQSARVGCVGAPFLTHEWICALLWNL